MASAEAVARYFIGLAALPEEASPMTHLQLHKLMYYAQGWSLASRDRQLFEGRIEAWAHGPAVAGLFALFADHGDNPIPWSMAALDASLSSDDRALIEAVWNDYGRYSAWRLREMTHMEPPWKRARAGTPEGVPGGAPISEESLRLFFASLQEAKLRRIGIDPVSLERSLQQVRDGDTICFEQLRAETLAAGESRTAGLGPHGRVGSANPSAGAGRR